MMHSLMISLVKMNNVHLLFFAYDIIGDYMKKILLSEYKEGMGTFIEINDTYNNVVKNSIHIPYEHLIVNYKELLDKNVKYYIYCKGGIKSKRAVNILEFYGYDVTLVN